MTSQHSHPSVEELLLKIEATEGHVAGALRETLKAGGAELADELAAALPSLRGDRAAAACRALAVIGPEARAALPALEEVSHRRSALLLRASEAAAAERAIVSVRADEPEFVLEALASTKPELRHGAVDALASGRVPLDDADAQVVAEGLAQMLPGHSAEATSAVIAALRVLGVRAEPAVPRLIALATEPSVEAEVGEIPRVRYVIELGKMGAAGIVVGPALARLLVDPEEPVRLAAMRWLPRVGPQSTEAIPPLLYALRFQVGRDAQPESSVEVAPAVPVEQPEDVRQAQEAEVRSAAARALGELGEPNSRVLEALIDATHSTSARLRYHAVTALERIGHASDAVVISLCSVLLEDRTSHVASRAAHALGTIAPAHPNTLPALAAALEAPQTRKAAAWALARCADVSEAVAELIEAFDANRARRAVVTRALLAAGPTVLRDLQRGLHRDDRWVRIGCAESVGALGPEANSAAPTLRELLFDRRRDVQEAAEEALEAISEGG